MRYQKAIRYLFPNDSRFMLEDAGNGVYIKEWNIDAPIPTDEELEQAEILAEAKETKESRKKEIIAELSANDLKAIRAIADGDIVRIEEHKTKQSALRIELSLL